MVVVELFGVFSFVVCYGSKCMVKVYAAELLHEEMYADYMWPFSVMSETILF